MMDKRTEAAGKRAASILNGELDVQINNSRALVDVAVLENLLAYVKALEEPPVKTTHDVYLMGEWYNTILKADLTASELALLRELGERSKDTSCNIEVAPHNPEYPLPNWKGYSRK